MIDQILKRADKGESVAAIATALSVSPGYVYGILREHRPNRPRKARERTSDRPRIIAGLAAQGMAAGRIAKVLGISRAYAHRHMKG